MLAGGNIEAKDLYVSTTGSDAVTVENNDIDHPWLTPLVAWTNAQAGDIVYFRAGTYTITEQIWTKYYGHDGTEANPIIFTSYPGETVAFNSSLSVVFRIERDWNIIRGINCTGGGTFFSFGWDTSVTGGGVEDCTATMTAGGDNLAFVSAERSVNTTVKNCKITGPGTGAGIHLNTACIIAFNAPGLRILNCELSSAPIAIYYKHGHTVSADTGIEIAYNYIHDTSRYSMELNTIYANVHNNLMGANNANLRINESNGGANGDYNTLNHNTLYTGIIRLSDDDDGANNNTITNNIMAGRTTCCSNNTWDYNMYVSGEAIGPHDLGNTSPTYVGAGSPTTIADFALTSLSAGYRAGSDGKDMGADVALIGVNAGEEGDDTTPPTVTITTSPQTVSTSSVSISFTASDDIGVTSRKWHIGSAPDATHGTECTSPATATGLSVGQNTVYIGAGDAAGNWGSDSITVNYSPVASSTTIINSGIRGGGGVR